MGRSRKPLCLCGHRGFESHPLRQHLSHCFYCFFSYFSTPIHPVVSGACWRYRIMGWDGETNRSRIMRSQCANISVGLFFSTTQANDGKDFGAIVDIRPNGSALHLGEGPDTTRISLDMGSIEPKKFPLLRPCKRQPGSFGEPGRRQRRWMAAFENGPGDVGGEERLP